MNKKNREIQIARIREISEKWIHSLGLGWYNIDFLYFDDLKTWKSKKLSEDAIMYCQPDWRYRIATIGIWLPAVTTLDDVQLMRCVIHELVHILVCEMQGNDVEQGHVERTVTGLVDAFLWVRGGTIAGKL